MQRLPTGVYKTAITHIQEASTTITVFSLITITNPNDTVGLTISAANLTVNYIDIGFKSPTANLKAYQFKIHGINIQNVVSLASPVSFPVDLRFNAFNVAGGLGKISRPRFVTANMLGRGMACALTSAASAFGGAFSWQAWVVILSIFILIGIAWQIYRRRKTS